MARYNDGRATPAPAAPRFLHGASSGASTIRPWAGAAQRLVLFLLGVVVVVLAGLLPARAAHADGAPTDPVPVVAMPDGLSLVGHIGHQEDARGDFSLAAVCGPRDAGFLYPDDPLRGKESRRVLWFKVRLQLAHAGDAQRDWLLVVPTVSTHDLRFYGPYADGEPAGGASDEPALVTGMRHPYATRAYASEKMAFPFRLPDTRVYTVYMRVDSDFARLYAMELWSPADYLVSTQDKRLFDGLCYGVLLAMLVLAPSLLVVFRERIYADYLLSCAFALLSLANFNGHGLRYLFPDWPTMAELSYRLAPALWAICKLMFARRLLDLPCYAPRIDLVVRGVVVFLTLASAASLLGLTVWLLPIVQASVVAATGVMLIGAVAALRRGYGPAVFYLISVGTLLASVSLIVIESWGWVGWRAGHMNVTQIALSAEVVIFAAALASRIRLLSRTAQRLQQQTTLLQRELDADPLTGSASRKGFERRGQALIDAGVPFAVMLMDLDRFKGVNDSHGHLAGDAVLRAVAARVREHLRASDLVARLGGDEFAMLVVQPRDRADLHTLGLRILDAVRQPVPHEGVLLSVDGSLGIAGTGFECATLAERVREADMAMYRCKKAGHGSMAFAEDAASPEPGRGDTGGPLALRPAAVGPAG